MKKLLFFTVLIGIVSGCSDYKKDQYFKFEDPTLFVFEKGDTLTYFSENSVDSFYVFGTNHFYEVSDKYYYYEEFFYSLSRINQSIRGFTIQRHVGVIDFYGYNFFESVSYNEIVKEEYQISNKTIQDVYEVLVDEKTDYQDVEVKTIFYNHIYGIVAYELYNGALYKINPDLIQD